MCQALNEYSLCIILCLYNNPMRSGLKLEASEGNLNSDQEMREVILKNGYKLNSWMHIQGIESRKLSMEQLNTNPLIGKENYTDLF